MLQGIIDRIKNAILGREVRDAIADGIQTIYDEAVAEGNNVAELQIARGKYGDLGSRLYFMEEKFERLRLDMDTIGAYRVSISPTEKEVSDGEILIIYEE